MSAATLRSVNDSLRDDLARLRVLADSVRTKPDRAGDLRAACNDFCDAFLIHHESKHLLLYPVLRQDVVNQLISSHRHIVVLLARIRHAEITGMHQALTDLAGVLEAHLRTEEEQGR